MNENMASKTSELLGKNILILLEATHMSQADFCRLTGWPSSRVTTLIQGKYDARLSTVEDVVAAFNRFVGDDQALFVHEIISTRFAVPEIFFRQVA